MVPTSFFCTFMKVRGKNSTIENNLEFKIDVQPYRKYTVEATRARSPSDVLWLNQGESISKKRCQIALISGTALILAWIVGFIFITEIGVQIYINYRKYPPTSTCLTTLHEIDDTVNGLQSL